MTVEDGLGFDDCDGWSELGGDCDDTATDGDGDGVPDGQPISPALGNCP